MYKRTLIYSRTSVEKVVGSSDGHLKRISWVSRKCLIIFRFLKVVSQKQYYGRKFHFCRIAIITVLQKPNSIPEIIGTMISYIYVFRYC